MKDKYSEYSDEYIGAPCGTEDSWNKWVDSLLHYVLIPEHCSNLSTVNINNDNKSTFSYKGSTENKEIDLSALVPTKKEIKTYRPLPSCLTIKESSIDGLGLFASKNIYLSDVGHPQDWCSHVFIQFENFSGDFVEELVRTSIGSHINHSKFPNCSIEEFYGHSNRSLGFSIKKYYLKPLRGIRYDEEITLDYTKELCGLTGYEGAEFLGVDKLLDTKKNNDRKHII